MIQLKLDQAALNSLFPEGSEARLNLQNACIAQFTKNIFERHMPEAAIEQMKKETAAFAERLATAIAGARQDIINQAAADSGLVTLKSGGHFSKPVAVLSEETIAQIKGQVVSHMNEEVRAVTTAAIEERVKAYVEHPGRFDAHIERVVRDRLGESIVAKVAAAVR